MMFGTVFNSISVISRRTVHLFMLSCCCFFTSTSRNMPFKEKMGEIYKYVKKKKKKKKKKKNTH